MNFELIYYVCGLAMISLPAMMFAGVGIPSFLARPFSERRISLISTTIVWLGLAFACAALAAMWVQGVPRVIVLLGNWYILPEEHFHFKFELILDRLSLPFTIMSFVLCGTISAFATKYLHREPGFHRFFILFSMFLTGIIVAALAGTIELLFVGWELVGLSSALLVAFFQERPAPVRNGLRVWSVYRIADASFLIAAVTMHHLVGEGDFASLIGSGAWPYSDASISGMPALFVGLLLLIAAMGKSALVPFSGWLPRAMEGPTPSSAIFYGALSVHLGVYLLLRVSPLLEQSFTLCAVITLIGGLTTVFAASAARVQADIKTSLAFASLTQVGLIVVEVGLGLRFIALVHLIGHACFRTLQLLRAPTLLHDYHTLENAVGGHLHDMTRIVNSKAIGPSAHMLIYRWSLERGYLDAGLNRFVAEPFMRFFRRCDFIEQRFSRWLKPGVSDEPANKADARTQLDD